MDTDLGPLTLAAIVDYIRIAMELAEEAIEAGDKAAYAQEIILRLIAESDMTEAEKTLCRTIVETGVLKDIFTLVVDTTKGKLNINKIKKATHKCCRRWFSCCCGKPEMDEETKEDETSDTPVPVEPPASAGPAASPAASPVLCTASTQV